MRKRPLVVVCSAAVTVFAFVVANYFNFSRTVTCSDCFFPYGVPLTVFREGGYGGGGGIVWRGVAADLALVVAVSWLLARIWQRAFGKS